MPIFTVKNSDDYSNSRSGQYDNSIICSNGHIVNEMVHRYPEDNLKYCEKCGAKSLDKCDKCNTLFKGNVYGNEYKLPLFCFNCGNVFPWTQLKIETAIELGLSSELINDQERDTLRSSTLEIIKDTPKTMLEAIKFKKVIYKIGNGTATMIKETLAAIISETAKKIIWPD